LAFSGFWKLACWHFDEGLKEMWRSISKTAFVKSLQKLIPGIRASDLVPCKAGVRAQAVAANGDLVEDFSIVRERTFIHVCNAPSPAATASLEIGDHIASEAISSIRCS